MTPWRSEVPIKVFDSLTSTNDSILLAGEDDAPEGTTHVAHTQTQGRGRGDHSWWSPPGAGLWMSTLLRPSRSSAHWGGISLVAGAAVRNAVESLGVRGVELYWPNDLQIGRRKLGGILGEVRSRGDRAWIALGIGINIDLRGQDVRATMPSELAAIAISLAEAGTPRTRDPVAIAAAILASFWPLYARFQAGEKIPSLVGKALAHAGRTVEIRIPGQPPWRGLVEGLLDDGALKVRPLTPGAQTVAITGGEVIYEADVR